VAKRSMQKMVGFKLYFSIHTCKKEYLLAHLAPGLKI